MNLNKKINFKSQKIFYGYALVVFIMLIIAFFYREELKLVYSDPEAVKNFISGFGIFGPIILIFLQFFQVIIFVIPGPVFTIAGGYAYGITWGTLYSFIGTLLGSSLVFYLGRTYGRPFVEKMVNKDDLDRYDKFISRRGKTALLICRVIPIILPNDVVSFAASVTKMRFRTYFWISFIGFIPNIFILNLFGDQLTVDMNPITIAIVAIVGMSILVYCFRKPLKKLFK